MKQKSHRISTKKIPVAFKWFKKDCILIVIIFHKITVFWSNKCIAGDHNRLLSNIKKPYQPQTFEPCLIFVTKK